MDAKLKRLLQDQADTYKKVAKASVTWNSHMNALDGSEVITTDKIDGVIDGFMLRVHAIQDISTEDGILNRSDVLALLKDQAVYSEPDKVGDALLVDFINRVWYNHRIDYALTTKDLDAERSWIFAHLVMEDGAIYMNPDVLETFKTIWWKMWFWFNDSPASIILEWIADEMLPYLIINSKSTTQRFIDFYYSIEDLSLRKGKMESSKLESVRTYIWSFRWIYPSILGKLFGPKIEAEACEILWAQMTDVYEKQAIKMFQDLS